MKGAPLTSRARHESFHRRINNSERMCNHPDCAKPGEFRAPKTAYRRGDFDGPGDYYWLCLDHVRAFNASYDYFDGVNEEEIHNQQRPWSVGNAKSGPLPPTAPARRRVGTISRIRSMRSAPASRRVFASLGGRANRLPTGIAKICRYSASTQTATERRYGAAMLRWSGSTTRTKWREPGPGEDVAARHRRLYAVEGLARYFPELPDTRT